jgi:hypothetical protein
MKNLLLHLPLFKKDEIMSTYIITFEIGSENDLDNFTKQLKSFGGYCPINKNAWAITTNKKAKELRDILIQFISGNDRMFIVRSGTEAAWVNSYSQEHSDWLKNNL